MTVEQAAQSLGVSAETLVREGTSKQTAWRTAPETTARGYIVESYGGNAAWN